ncbi:apolipoprotein N-acyltransferase [Shewanella sp.]|uniref:apolipoprotein N-acyltransferase n=1 Tax=Shewanella sp. TaxID=50422 RepID=UPI00356AE967
MNRITDSRRLSAALAFLAGASTSLAFAPYALWPIYPLAIAFTLLLGRDHGPKAAFWHWLSFGFGAFVFGISWVHVSIDQFGGLPLVVSLTLMGLLALYLALYPALAGTLFARFKGTHQGFNLLGLFPALWILTEFLRGWMLTGFPWLWAGYSQTDGPLLPLAQVIGVQGIGLLVIMLAGAISLLFHRRPASLLFLLPSLSLSVYWADVSSTVARNGDTVKVALVQGNVAQSMKWQPEQLWPTMLKYMDLSRPHLDADIILWPEAAIPAPEHMVEDFLDNANRVANLNDSAIITGIISRQNQRWYNSLIVLGNHNAKHQDSPDYLSGGGNEFRKHHLLPIGEFVPFESLLRPLAPFFNLPMSSFNRGDYQQPNLKATGFSLAPAICYEIAFPEQLRLNVTPDTDLLLTVSNDAWFGTSNGPLQHMEIARMRSAELGRPLIRSTNNGVTAVVDEKGQITASLPQFETAVLNASIALVSGETWFAQWGHIPVQTLCALLFILALLNRQRAS